MAHIIPKSKFLDGVRRRGGGWIASPDAGCPGALAVMPCPSSRPSKILRAPASNRAHETNGYYARIMINDVLLAKADWASNVILNY